MVGKVYAQDSVVPGSQIKNIATVSYTESNSGTEVVQYSNEVEVLVGENTEFRFWPNNTIADFRGTTVEITHYLLNEGNVTATYFIKGFNLENDDYNLQQIGWSGTEVRKTVLNRTFVTDTITTEITLEPGEELVISYTGDISAAEERINQTALMKFEVTDIESGITKVNVDSINVLIGAIVDIQKYQIGADELKREDRFDYVLDGENIGDMTALPREILVDGSPLEKVILMDSIPANLTFIDYVSFDKGIPLYHEVGAAKYEFTTSKAADSSMIDVIGLAFDSLQVGETFSTTFTVMVNPTASGRIINVAELSYVDPEGTVVTAAASNAVTTEIDEVTAEINYFTNQNFNEKTATSSIGDSLHVQATASACNENRALIERVDITLASTQTGDLEYYTGVETGVNSGVFQILEAVPTRDGVEFPVIVDNKILETVEEDVISATLDCSGLQGGAGTSIRATVLVDPYGIVFDSETNSVVSGAIVNIIDVTGANNGGNPGGPAVVYYPNGRDVISSTSTSGTQGKYRFPFLRPGTYRLEVTPPSGYEFSSEVPFDSLDPARKVDSLASYGREFVISGNPTGLDFDIPLDPLATGVLLAKKTVDRTEAEIGDYVNYSISVTSNAVNVANNLTVTDNLPFGFKYVEGTARLDGESIADPAGGAGPTLQFAIGSINPGEELTLTYRVYIGPGSERSDGINSAIVQSEGVITRISNEAKVKIEVNGGVFSDEALIVGKVFLDCDENNMQDGSEPGIPGVRLYLENGNYIITDGEGKYSFYAVKPNKHVLKLDNHSLPEGSRLKVLDNRHAFDPSSRFVDVKKGELHRADFAVCECNAAIFEEIEQRAALQNGNTDAISNSLKQNFNTTDNTSQSIGRFGKASGTVGNVKAPEIRTSNAPGVASSSSTNTPENNSIEVTEKEAPQRSIEDVIQSAAPGTELLNVVNGDTLESNKITVWAKGANGALFDLYINGKVVSASRIGQRSSSNLNSIQIWEYVSLDLDEGANNIALYEGDPFGNIRGADSVTVYVPGALKNIELEVLRDNVPADGNSTALLEVRLTDANGLLVGSRQPVTLDVSKGTWLLDDANAKDPGTQIFIEGGRAQFELKAPIEPVTSDLRISVGDIYTETEIEFLPDLRPLIAAGIIEGTLRLNEPLNIASATEADGFERELKQLSYSMNNFTVDGRFAFFLKGKVTGRTLLTAAYDSEKETEERMFRDIRPDEYYPVYGDAAIRGFDAQSTGRLYIRADRGKTYALYGDFITQQNNADIQIGAYNRSQNGVKTHVEDGKFSVDAFAVNSVSSRRIREFRGQGISRYELPDQDLISNSEIIEIIVYDREQLTGVDSTGVINNPNFILSRERLTRFTDYAVDPFTGVITFKNPVSSVDANFNPVYIRATYEVENDAERYLVGGVGAKYEVTEGVGIGANLVHDANPGNEFTMASSNMSVQLGKDTKMVAEFARTSSDAEGSGNAGRLQIQHRGDKYDINTQIGKSSDNFKNEGAMLGQARTEARATGSYRIGKSTSLDAEFTLSRNDTTKDQTLGSRVTVQQKVAQGVNAQVGVRYSEQTYSSSEDVVNTNLTSKLTAQLPFIKGASTFGEYEQDLNAADRRLVALGGDYKLGSFAKAFARHEFVSSTGGRNTLQSTAQRNNTVFGINANYMKNGQVFSEYRMNDAIDGRTGQASIGLRNRFTITEGLGMNAGFERIFTVQGPNGNDGTAISTAIDYTGSANWKGTARAEARFGSNTDTYLNSIGYGLKLSRDWTLLARNIVSISSTDGVAGIQKMQERFQVGTAYRSSYTNQFDALFRYEMRHEIDESIADDYFQTAHVLISHANYKPSSDLVFTGRVGAKYAVTSDDLQRNSSFLELVSGRATYDLNERWDAGINATILANSDFTTKDYGLGGEVGYIVATNLRIAAGYNFFGYEDEDLAANEYTRQGAYLGFAYKFDEQVFKSLAPNRAEGFLTEELYEPCIPCSIPEVQTLEVPRLAYEMKPLELTRDLFDYEKMSTLVILPRQIHFDNDKSYINQSAAQMLDKIAKYLMEEEDYLIDLNGFTDMKASVAYNKALSERRSLAVRAYLVAAGVDRRRMIIEGFGEVDALGKDIVEMAKERRVEFDINNLNDDVAYVDQVEDLQINQKAKEIGGWEYIFKTEHNAVPVNINLQAGSDKLNYLNKYMVQRIAIALNKYPEIGVRIALPADDRFFNLQQQILTELAANSADINRYMFSRGVDGDQNTIRISYEKESLLQLFEQKDDITFLKNNKIPALLESLVRVLNSRTDYELLNDFSQSYVVPDRINFMAGSAKIDNESQAVLSRIGSYLRNNAATFLELRGDGTQRDRNRMIEIQKFLANWGIDAGRISISDITVQTDRTAIRVEYKNADSINLLNTKSLNLRPGVGAGM